MPHALTDRQKECLQYIRDYVAQNESSPRLEEIAAYLDVKAPTAHKLLEALQSKGFILFGRTRTSGFYIRLIERAGSAEVVIEIPIVGKVDQYGEVYDFPQLLGHFATLLIGANPGKVFALAVWEDIPQASILSNDLLICDHGKRAQPGNICLIPFGLKSRRWFLCQMFSLTYDESTPQELLTNSYPIPEEHLNKGLGQKLYWRPLAYDEETEEYLMKIAQEEEVPMGPIPPELVAATVLRLTRPLAF